MRILPSLCSLALASFCLAQVDPVRAERIAHAQAVAQSPMVYGERLCVKLAEGCGAELVDGALVSRTGADLGAVAKVFARAAAAPLFTALPWDELDRLHRRACVALPRRDQPGHLGLWFRLTSPSAAAADELTAALFALDLVEHVHKEPRATPASLAPLPPTGDLAPPTPLFTALQQSHQPAPIGYGIWRSQGIYGARGQGVRVRMIEDDWHLDHEDISQLVAANFLGPVSPGTTTEAIHGIAGASIVFADRNAYGMTGVADEAEVRFVSELTNGGVANAILLAGANSVPGDVHLMVLIFLFGQLGADDWIPMEFLQSVYDATRTVTANGVIFVTSCGNGGRSLDDPRLARRFDRSFRDSGAIFVGATAGNNGQLMTRAIFSNFGSRVDCNGWGDGVVACGVGSLFHPNQDNRQAYTATYAGTSPAVPAIAGIVTALQGAARAQLGRSLGAAEVLSLLHTYGTPSPDTIGRRPDLVAMLQALGAIDGLETSAPDLPLGGSATVDLRGAPGAAGFLFTSFTTGSTDFGFNRRILLGLGTMQTIGFLPLPQGTASFTLVAPNDPGLHGVSLYFQAGVLAGTAPIHVTNSVQLTIL